MISESRDGFSHLGSWNSSTSNGEVEVTLYELMSIVPPPASMINTLFPGLNKSSGWKTGAKNEVRHLKCPAGSCADHTVIKRRLPFSNEREAGENLLFRKDGGIDD